MGPAHRKDELITKEERQKLAQELVDFFERERDERIGLIAAGNLLDHVLDSAGKVLFNKGIEAAQRAMEARIQELNYDLDELKEE